MTQKWFTRKFHVTEDRPDTCRWTSELQVPRRENDRLTFVADNSVSKVDIQMQVHIDDTVRHVYNLQELH